MYDNEYFVVDMATCTTTGEIINSLSLALETLEHSGKKIVLKLNESYLNQSQLLSIQSLITSYGCILDTIETINEETARTAENMNIFIQKPLEKRVEDKYINKDTDFEPLSIASGENKSEIVNIKDAPATNYREDIQEIAAKQDINIAQAVEQMDNLMAVEQEVQRQKEIEQQKTEIEPEEKEVTFITEEAKEIEIKPEAKQEESEPETKEENLPTLEEVEHTISQDENEFEHAEKNSIGVYKKAYDENEIEGEQWEEVDFYETATDEPVVSDSKNTVYINQTLRSGQVFEADGNVVIIGDCHPGSEIRATGDITVWGVLSGIAHGGYKGNLSAKVRALKLNAVQLRIGNCYSRRPDTTNIPYIVRSPIFTPEEARVVDGEIMLFKINQN